MAIVKLASGFVIILFYIRLSTTLQYVPPNQHVAVHYNGSYRVGVEDVADLDITLCRFLSDTGFNCTFGVYYTRENGKASYVCRQSAVNENVVSQHGRDGLCLISVDWVRETGPVNWTLIAEDSYGDVILKAAFKVNYIPPVTLLETKIALYEHASFINYMSVPSQIHLRTCTLIFNETVIELDMDSSTGPAASSSLLLDNEEILRHVSSLGEGLCGIKYTNATQIIDTLEWTLSAIDTEGRAHRPTFITHITPSNSSDKKIEVALGEKFRIDCGVLSEPDYCYLLNPTGETIRLDNCVYNDLHFKMDDVGTWGCYYATKYSTELTMHKIELARKIGEDTVTTWVNEADHYVKIGCQLPGYNGTSKIKSCKMITPNSQVLNLKPFSATGRYQAMGTDYTKALCSLQIPKPLQEFENGMWQCEIIFIDGSSAGGFIEVNKTENALYPKNLKVVARLGEPLTVSCEVPYPSEFCAIYKPNGEQYLNQPTFNPKFGRCSLTINDTVSSHAGTWICSFAHKMGVPEDKIRVEVSIAESLVSEVIPANEIGASVSLKCHSNGHSLKHCRFTSPVGDTYYIHNHENSTNINYYGKGLEYGECGITILETQISDFGKWICSVQLNGELKDDELLGTIWLQ